MIKTALSVLESAESNVRVLLQTCNTLDLSAAETEIRAYIQAHLRLQDETNKKKQRILGMILSLALRTGKSCYHVDGMEYRIYSGADLSLVVSSSRRDTYYDLAAFASYGDAFYPFCKKVLQEIDSFPNRALVLQAEQAVELVSLAREIIAVDEKQKGS